MGYYELDLAIGRKLEQGGNKILSGGNNVIRVSKIWEGRDWRKEGYMNMCGWIWAFYGLNTSEPGREGVRVGVYVCTYVWVKTYNICSLETDDETLWPRTHTHTHIHPDTYIFLCVHIYVYEHLNCIRENVRGKNGTSLRDLY